MARNSLIEVRGSNFRSISDEQVYELEDQGLVLINGRNGEGKTSLFIELPVWVLYGRTPEEKVPGDAIKNRHVKGDVVGVLKFRSTTGLEYRVTRRRGSKNGLSLELWDGVRWIDQSMTTPTETQVQLERVWGEDYETFSNTRLFTSDVVHYPRYTDAEKKAVIDKLLGLDKLANAGESVKADLRKAEERERVLEWSLSEKVKALDKLNAQLDEQLDLSDAWADKVKAERKELKARQKQLTELIAESGDRVKRISMKCDAIREEIGRLSQKLEEPSSLLADLKEKLAERRADLRHAENDVSVLQAQLKRLSSTSKERKCRECGQPIAATTSERQLKEVEEQLNDASVKVEKIGFKIAHFMGVKEQLEKQVGTLEGAITELTDALSDKTRKVRNLQDQTSSMRDELADIPERLKATDNPHPAEIKSLQDRISALKAEHKEVGDELVNVKTEKTDLKIIGDCFGNRGFRTLLIEAAIPFLNSKLSFFASAIDSPILVELQMKPNGELTILVDHPEGGNRYKDCSRGERRIIDLLILFSFFELRAMNTGGYPPQIVFDEAFENVDAGWQENLAGLLKTIVDGGTSVLFISHSAGRLEGLADHTWRITRGRIVRESQETIASTPTSVENGNGQENGGSQDVG